jgi:integrase
LCVRPSTFVAANQEPATADLDGLRRFLEGDVLPWFETRKKELANRPLIREQAFGESLDPDKLERLGRYEVHLDRKLENLAPTSQAVRKTVLEAFRREHGDKQIAAMPTKFLRALLDAMEPTAAKNWLAAIRALITHAIKSDLIENDPTLGIKLRRMTGDRFHTWTEEQIAQFEAAHPIGSRERLAFALGLHTGQRRGDVVAMGRQHIRNGLLHVTQRKTGKVLAIPIHPDLQTILATVPATQMTFVMTLRGKPFDPHAFTAWFVKACGAAGLPSICTFHGLRKAACRRLAEAGCTVHEIAAISGHATLKEVERYTKAADQQRLAQAAMARAAMAQKGAA